jgi:hypothetical protein
VSEESPDAVVGSAPRREAEAITGETRGFRAERERGHRSRDARYVVRAGLGCEAQGSDPACSAAAMLVTSSSARSRRSCPSRKPSSLLSVVCFFYGAFPEPTRGPEPRTPSLRGISRRWSARVRCGDVQAPRAIQQHAVVATDAIGRAEASIRLPSLTARAAQFVRARRTPEQSDEADRAHHRPS